MKVLGLDISKGKVTACILEAVPASLKRYHQQNKLPEFKADREGIEELLALDFDVVALEPTGIHYARIWIHHLQPKAKEIRWVGHREIRHYRESHKLPNKSDNADAIAIAAYTLERWHQTAAFVDGEAEELRYQYLQLQTLSKSRTQLINRLKQQLCHECPEIADRDIKRNWLAPSAGILSAIAGEKISKKWQKELEQSIGMGIGDFSRGLAKQILEIERQEIEIEQAIAQTMQREDYAVYRKALDLFGIEGRTAAALISTIHPFNRFLSEEGREIVERVDGSKRYRSLARFKLTLGIGKVQHQSGGELRWKKGGSSECRRALYLWVTTNIQIHPDLDRPKIARLYDYYKNGSRDVVDGELVHFDPGKGNQRIMRVVRRLVEDLFYELLTAK